MSGHNRYGCYKIQSPWKVSIPYMSGHNPLGYGEGDNQLSFNTLYVRS